MNRKYADILKLARFQILLIVMFIFFKSIRPTILNSTSPDFFKTTLLSLPNFFEAVIGTLILTGIGLIINDKLNKKKQIRLTFLYVFAIILSGILVITQELNIIHIRTNTTFDRNDLIFSVIGLIIGYAFVLFIKPRIYNESGMNV